MPIYSPADADAFEAHGSRFSLLVRTERGGSTLCAWRLEVAPDLAGVAHRPTHEEVMLLLEGRLRVTLDGEGPGDRCRRRHTRAGRDRVDFGRWPARRVGMGDDNVWPRGGDGRGSAHGSAMGA